MASETLEENKPEEEPPVQVREEPKPEEVKGEGKENEVKEEENLVGSEKDVSGENEEPEEKNVVEEEKGQQTKEKEEDDDEEEEEQGEEQSKKAKRGGKKGQPKKVQSESRKPSDESADEKPSKQLAEKKEKEPVTPGSERPTRERKMVERYSVPEPGRSATKPLSIEKVNHSNMSLFVWLLIYFYKIMVFLINLGFSCDCRDVAPRSRIFQMVHFSYFLAFSVCFILDCLSMVWSKVQIASVP